MIACQFVAHRSELFAATPRRRNLRLLEKLLRVLKQLFPRDHCGELLRFAATGLDHPDLTR